MFTDWKNSWAKNRSMGRHKKAAKGKCGRKSRQKNKGQDLPDLSSFDFTKKKEISNTSAIEEKNMQILANLPRSRYKSDGNEPLMPPQGPGFLLTAEYASDMSDEDDFPFSPDQQKIQQLKELNHNLSPIDDIGLSTLTAVPGFSYGFSSLEESKEFLDFTKMIKEQGYEQTQEYDEDGNLRSVSFTQIRKRKNKKKVKKIRPHVNTPEEPEDEENGSRSKDKASMKKVEVEVNIGITDMSLVDDTEVMKSNQKAPLITCAETDIGKAIESANRELLEKAKERRLNCEDIAKHTAFLAEQRQSLKDHMDALQKKIRIHNSLIKVNGRNLLKHFTIVTSLEKAIFATKRDSIRFNIVLNQFLSSPAYATMLDSFERITKKMPKEEDKDTRLPPEFCDYSNSLSFEDLLEQEKKDLHFDLSKHK